VPRYRFTPFSVILGSDCMTVPGELGAVDPSRIPEAGRAASLHSQTAARLSIDDLVRETRCCPCLSSLNPHSHRGSR
jgi:hypothetical protein